MLGYNNRIFPSHLPDLLFLCSPPPPPRPSTSYSPSSPPPLFSFRWATNRGRCRAWYAAKQLLPKSSGGLSHGAVRGWRYDLSLRECQQVPRACTGWFDLTCCVRREKHSKRLIGGDKSAKFRAKELLRWLYNIVQYFLQLILCKYRSELCVFEIKVIWNLVHERKRLDPVFVNCY